MQSDLETNCAWKLKSWKRGVRSRAPATALFAFVMLRKTNATKLCNRLWRTSCCPREVSFKFAWQDPSTVARDDAQFEAAATSPAASSSLPGSANQRQHL